MRILGQSKDTWLHSLQNTARFHNATCLRKHQTRERQTGPEANTKMPFKPHRSAPLELLAYLISLWFSILLSFLSSKMKHHLTVISDTRTGSSRPELPPITLPISRGYFNLHLYLLKWTIHFLKPATFSCSVAPRNWSCHTRQGGCRTTLPYTKAFCWVGPVCGHFPDGDVQWSYYGPRTTVALPRDNASN